MTLIYAHAALAIISIPLGLYIFLTRKGTRQHKRLGMLWVSFLILVSVSAIFIQETRPGQYSLIHLLIPWTLGSLAHALWSIRKFKRTRDKKYKRAHMYTMIGLYIGALLVAGTFALMPGRVLHQILFTP